MCVGVMRRGRLYTLINIALHFCVREIESVIAIGSSVAKCGMATRCGYTVVFCLSLKDRCASLCLQWNSRARYNELNRKPRFHHAALYSAASGTAGRRLFCQSSYVWVVPLTRQAVRPLAALPYTMAAAALGLEKTTSSLKTERPVSSAPILFC